MIKNTLGPLSEEPGFNPRYPYGSFSISGVSDTLFRLPQAPCTHIQTDKAPIHIIEDKVIIYLKFKEGYKSREWSPVAKHLLNAINIWDLIPSTTREKEK